MLPANPGWRTKLDDHDQSWQMQVENLPHLMPPSLFMGLNAGQIARCANAVLAQQGVGASAITGIAVARAGYFHVYVVHDDWVCSAAETGMFKKKIEIDQPRSTTGIVDVRTRQTGGTKPEDIAFWVEGLDAEGNSRVAAQFVTGASSPDYVDSWIPKQVEHLDSLLRQAVGLSR